MALTKIYLVRHAEAEGNLYRRLHGWYDSCITENGYRQMEALTERFRNIPVEAVYSSDLFRTRTTASAIWKPKGLELKPTSALREIHVGKWEDAPFADVVRRDPGEYALFNQNLPDFDLSDSEAETFQQVRTRVTKAIKDIARIHQGQTVVVVSHGVAIRNALACFMDYSIEQTGEKIPHGDNTAVSLLEVDQDKIKVAYYNDNSHLPNEISTFFRQHWWRDTNNIEDSNLWFRPLNMEKDGQVYYNAREEAWQVIHGSMLNFNGEGFLRDATDQARFDERSVIQVMLGDQPAGILQLNMRRESDQGVGAIPFFYMLPQYRGKGLGIQLLGQAVSVYRPMGRTRLRLRCAPDNYIAQRFYQRYGFRKIGEDPGSRVPLDIMEKKIGFIE